MVWKWRVRFARPAMCRSLSYLLKIRNLIRLSDLKSVRMTMWPNPSLIGNARVKALLRRSEFAADPQLENEADTEIVSGDLHPSRRFLGSKGQQRMDLTHREFELLYHLATHVGQVMTREHLLETVWGYDYFGDVRTVDVTVRRLREKIETHRGVRIYLDPPWCRILYEKQWLIYKTICHVVELCPVLITVGFIIVVALLLQKP